jgi:hypothetical protein
MEENDRLLLELAQRCKGLEPMLDAVFSFLKRKTDLYVEQGPGDLVGFPPGEARNIVLKSFDKFARAGGAAPDKKVLEAVGMRLQGDASAVPSQGQTLPPLPPQKLLQADASAAATVPHAAAALAPPSVAPIATSSLPHYNGAALEHYAWSQTLTDVTISVPLAAVCPAKGLSVSITKSSVSVQRRDVDAACFVLRGALPHDIDTSESLWNLDGTTVVTAYIQCFMM